MARRRLFITIGLVFAAAALLVGVYTIAGAQPEDEKSRFVRFVERQISTPDRQIRLGRIDGVLSSDVRISSITVADREGVWLTIEDVHLIWTRSALLRGRLDVDLLEAERIELARPPLPPEEEIPEEAEFKLPELPVEVAVDTVSVPRVEIAEGVIGPAAALGIEGSMQLADGSLASNLTVERLDAGGSLVLDATYTEETRILDLELRLSEPRDGVLVNLLNLQDKPALTFVIAGSGPLDEFAAEISLMADDAELVSGTSTISRVADGFRFLADVGGNLRPLVPGLYAELVDDGSRLAIDATRLDSGTITVRRAELRSGVALLTASAELASDGFPTRLQVDAELGGDGDEPVTLPGGGGAASIGSGRFALRLGGGSGDNWSATFEMTDLRTPTVNAKAARILAGGLAERMADPENRHVTFDLSGAATGLSSERKDVAEALGEKIELMAQGGWSAGEAVEVAAARLSNGNMQATFAGTANSDDLRGDYALKAENLALFAGIAGRDLRGAADLAASGTLGLSGRSFALDIEATARDLGLGIEGLDGVLAGKTTLSGGIARDRDGYRFDALNVENERANVRIEGFYGRALVDLRATAKITKLSAATERAAGAASLEAQLGGSAERTTVAASLSSDDLELMGRPFERARAEFQGTITQDGVAGTLALTGNLGGVPVEATGELASLPGDLWAIEAFDFRAGRSRAGGNLTLHAGGLYSGAFEVNAPDLSEIAPLLLAEADGAISADVTLAVEDGGQSADIDAKADGLRYDAVRVGTADIAVSGEDLFRAPRLSGRIAAERVKAGAVVVEALTATADRTGETTAFRIDADLVQGVLATQGTLQPAEGGFDLSLATLHLTHRGIEAKLARPVEVSVRENEATISRSMLLVGDGRIELSGTVGDTLDLSALVTELPLSVANALAPDLDLDGTVSGALRAEGTLADPRASFELTGRAISARALREAGVGRLSASARGRVSGRVVSIDRASAEGDGLSFGAEGTVPLDGRGLALSVTGTVPLALTDRLLAERGARLAGNLALDARVTGSLSAPRFSGSLSGEDLRFADSDTGLRITGMVLRASLDNDRLTIRQLSASVGSGTVRVTGSVGISPGRGFPADLSITMRNARYSDERLIAATLDGDLALTGPLTGRPLIRGTVYVERAEITVPEELGENVAMLDVRHANAPPEVAATLRRARVGPEADRGGSGGTSGVGIDITIEAPARVFVRGRGLDVELGGSVTLTGSSSNIRPVGAFEMIRGRISILAQRITFDRGTVTLFGDLIPYIDFVGTTRNNSITVTIAVRGRASDPEVSFSSVPDLPQDEILARLLFGRSITQLTPLQIARLAAAAAELAGGGGNSGILDSIRATTGLDNLDVITQEGGGIGVEAGRYINENIYLGVQAGEESADATVNLDITPELKLRGTAGTEDSSLGVFFEREY